MTLTSDQKAFVAVDLGAGSGRVFLASISLRELSLEEIRRFTYPPGQSSGRLRWDFDRIYSEIKAGLKQAGVRARERGLVIHSIGVDSWAVDYGLLDQAGRLIENPVCYRDPRTDGIMDEVFRTVPAEEIFDRTGIQFLVFNTLFQLYAHQKSGLPTSANRLLLIPDLINYFLTGRQTAEYTNATTTQFLNAYEKRFDEELLSRLGLPLGLFAEIVPAGTELGSLRDDLARELGLESVLVIAPATHDTASAVVGAPIQDNEAYISSGTWSLVGVERNEVLINGDVASHNFTNEGGAYGTVRFLKNVMGLWLLERCRAEWSVQGLRVDYDQLLSEVSRSESYTPCFFPDDPRLLNPESMVAAIEGQFRDLGAKPPEGVPAFAKSILDSLALRYSSVVRSIETLTGKSIEAIRVVGGGSRNSYLNQATANASGKSVIAGPVEATVIGNVMVQAISAGLFDSLSAARSFTESSFIFERFEPAETEVWTNKSIEYRRIESVFGASMSHAA